MSRINSTTRDLAELVSKKIDGAKVEVVMPNKKVLENLFENLFYASMKTEEGEFIKVTVTLIDSKSPDPSPPMRIVKDRWNYIYFEEPLAFTVKNIAKLSKAADPWSSSLAVDFDDNNELFIWGMIDQAVHYQSFLHYEAESGPEQPGLFQTSITNIGTIVVIFDYELIATLKQNILVSNYLDVFNKGHISEVIRKFQALYKEQLKTFIEKEFSEEDFESWEEYFENIWIQTLSRILIRIQNYRHGGAFLITDGLLQNLDIKHKVSYGRLFSSMVDLAKLAVSNSFYSNVIHYHHIEDDKPIPKNLYLEETISQFTKDEVNDEPKGAIRFVASMSCIDGIVVLDSDLKVNGFGVVIKDKELPDSIYLSTSAIVRKNRLTKVSPNHFGTRHRSIFSYCWKNADSLGFVVSTDGDIRVVFKVEDKLIMWENVKVQQLFRSGKLRRASAERNLLSR